MNTEWINIVAPLALCLFYGYKIFFKKQKTVGHGFMLGLMLILLILSLSKPVAKILSLIFFKEYDP